MRRGSTGGTRALCGALVALLGLLGWAGASAAPAQAYELGGAKWPGGTVRYYETLPAAYDPLLAEAVRAWNTSGVRVRFVRVKSKSRADTRIFLSRSRPWDAGWATLGAWHASELGLTPIKWGAFDIRWQRLEVTRTLVHELGHVLGLNHTRTRACAAMDPGGAGSAASCPRPAGPWQYLCRQLWPDDLAGAAKRYGGRPKLSPRFCDYEPQPPQLLDVRFSGGAGEEIAVRISWRRPPGLRNDARIYVDRNPAGRCNDEAKRIMRYVLKPGATAWVDEEAFGYKGRYCYVLRVVGKLGHPAPAVTRVLTSFIDRPGQPSITSLLAVGGLVQVTGQLADPQKEQLIAHYGPAGQCPTAYPPRQDVVLSVYPSSSTTWNLDGLPPGAWCISFFSVSPYQTSTPLMREFVMPEPSD